jgi:hypothetical protein
MADANHLAPKLLVRGDLDQHEHRDDWNERDRNPRGGTLE